MRDTSQDELDEIIRLRREGQITAKEAYERHLAALSVWTSRADAVTSAASPVVELPPGSPSLWLQPLALFVAVVGGLLGAIGAVFNEVVAGGLLGPFIAAPIIEEAMKPAGVYILLIRWPRALFGRVHTAGLTAISGLCFALIESLVYVTATIPRAVRTTCCFASPCPSPCMCRPAS